MRFALLIGYVKIDSRAANRMPIGVASYSGKVRVIIGREGEITESVIEHPAGERFYLLLSL